MQALAVFVVLLAASACEPVAAVAGPAKQPAAPAASVKPVAPSRAQPTACVARPSTVYGQEEVTFRIEGQGAPGTTADVQLRDERAATVSEWQVALPAELRPAGLGSGDFLLIVGDNQVSCAVTVNRELSRATEKK